MPVTLGVSDVHVWYRSTTETAGAPLALLSADEIARHDRLQVAEDRRDFAEAHALLRRVLSLHGDVSPAEWQFESADGGKPYLAPGPSGPLPLTFSLTHTRGFVACAVAQGIDVGVDAELIDRPLDERGISTRFFSRIEDEAIRACPDHERQSRFIEFWTLKEAYIKAIGDGLSHPLDSFGFDLESSQGIRLEAPAANGEEWTFALFAPMPRVRMSVAVRRGPSTCGIRAWADGGGTELTPIRTSGDPEN